MHRRLNYDHGVALHIANCIEDELIERSLGTKPEELSLSPKVAYYIEQYRRSSLADIVILPHLDRDEITHLSTEHLQALAQILTGMLQHLPFELITVHDEFKAHPNNLNQVRWMYREIMAEIAESNVLDDLLSQIMGAPGTFNKVNFNLPELIRQSNYALC